MAQDQSVAAFAHRRLERAARIGATVLAVVTVLLFASTWIAKVSWPENSGAVPGKQLPSAAVIYRGRYWEYTSIGLMTPRKLTVEYVGFRGPPFPFTQGTIARASSDLIAFPFLLPVVVAASMWVTHYLRLRAIPEGHCRVCRYDLRGISAGVCPECGTVLRDR